MTTTQVAAPTALLVAGRSERGDVAALLRNMGFQTLQADGAEALERLQEPIALCLIDLRQNGEALRAVRAVRSQHPRAIVIGIADTTRPTAAADAIRAGVFDVLPRPPVVSDLEAILANAREQAVHAAAGVQTPGHVPTYGIVGTSAPMRLVMELVQRAANGRCGIVICGERSSGREMIARAIHAHGANRDAPFVRVDCSAPTPEELELHLFGVINRRSGSGAPERRSLERLGRHSLLHHAAGGIVFLDGVAELPARIQARLVRVLRDREVFLDEDREPVPLDVRPIASVEGTIDAALDEGRIRTDLYERLSVIRIDVPALRQRREDIPVLATHFVKDLCRASGKPIKTLTRPALTLLSALPWRGNASELRGLLERLILLVPQGLIRLEDVLAHVQLEGSVSPAGFDATLRQARAKFERDYIAAVLQHQHGRIPEAARVLGIQRTNLYRKMRRLNLMRGKTRRET